MSEIVRSCPLYGGENSHHFDQRKFRRQKVINPICQGCGLVYQSPRLTEEETTAFYQAEYRQMYQGEEAPIARDFSTQTARAVSQVDFIRPIIPAVSRHLDIGCSLGILLKQVQAGYHSQATGVEPGEAHRMYARKEGLLVYPSLEDLEKAGEARFDLISLSHVLEHLPDPVGYLARLPGNVLVPEGWLLLEVPNLYSHDSFEVAHLCAFSPHTLREVIFRSGFEMVKFEKHGRPNSAILPLYLTVLCRPASQPNPRPVLPERGVVIKRQAGMLKRRILEHLVPSQAWLRM
jgi:2-polyprenyl-3-methyl-5-hydroxy-6-metoxy-1,4-benzoquinol methylase